MKRMYYFIAICSDFSNRQFRMFGVVHDNLDGAYNCAFQHFTTDADGKGYNGRSIDRLTILFSHTN